MTNWKPYQAVFATNIHHAQNTGRCNAEGCSSALESVVSKHIRPKELSSNKYMHTVLASQ